MNIVKIKTLKIHKKITISFEFLLLFFLSDIFDFSEEIDWLKNKIVNSTSAENMPTIASDYQLVQPINCLWSLNLYAKHQLLCYLWPAFSQTIRVENYWYWRFNPDGMYTNTFLKTSLFHWLFANWLKKKKKNANLFEKKQNTEMVCPFFSSLSSSLFWTPIFLVRAFESFLFTVLYSR